MTYCFYDFYRAECELRNRISHLAFLKRLAPVLEVVSEIATRAVNALVLRVIKQPRWSRRRWRSTT